VLDVPPCGADAAEVLRDAQSAAVGHAGSDVELAYRVRRDRGRQHARDPVDPEHRGRSSTPRCSRPRRLCALRGRARARYADPATDRSGRTQARQSAVRLDPRRWPRPDRTGGSRVGRLGCRPEVLGWCLRCSRTAGADVACGGGQLRRGVRAELGEANKPRAGDKCWPRNNGAVMFGRRGVVKGGVRGHRGMRKRFGAGGVRLGSTSRASWVPGWAGGDGFLKRSSRSSTCVCKTPPTSARRGRHVPLFYQGRVPQPLLVRIAATPTSRGFGRPLQHRQRGGRAADQSPGIVVASPARPRRSRRMLRTCADGGPAGTCRGCVASSRSPCKTTRDLHEPGADGGSRGTRTGPDWASSHVQLGRGLQTTADGGRPDPGQLRHGLRMSMRVAGECTGWGIGSRVLDLRLLAQTASST